jgi:pimeloyl-ACP methyl ester carboxylesterase
MKRIAFGFLITILLTTCLGLSTFAPLRAQPSTDDVRSRASHDDIRTIDRFVPHVSTVYANTHELVPLFLREKIRRDDERPRQVVLMIHGATISSVPDFDLPFSGYSWMRFLAQAGFDVFTMDQEGYGLSSRPNMDDPCNTSLADQQLYLIPTPLSQPCAPSYPFNLTSVQTDWDEIDAAVDYIRTLRHVDKVGIISWSRGGLRVGGYVARHPDKIDRVIFYAPAYNRLAPDDPPADLPRPGVPMSVLGREHFHDLWDTQVHCDNQFVPGIRDVISTTMLAFEPLGSIWGAAGVRRAPNWNTPQGFNFWGWNVSFAGRIEVPALLIRGDLDTQVPESDVRALYADLGSREKVFVHVACASHYLLWENQHMILLRASREWLRHGTFHGQDTGSFAVDMDGDIHRDE